MVKRRRRPRLHKIESLAFVETTDRLERRGGKLYVVDSKGIYRAIQVEDEETKVWPKFQENIRKMTKAGEINYVVPKGKGRPTDDRPSRPQSCKTGSRTVASHRRPGRDGGLQWAVARGMLPHD